MTLLKIYRLGDPEDADAILTLSEGEHIIGRGFLNCNDKRVSRKHGIISIEKDVIVLKSVHVNPCFYKSVENNSISLLSKDESVVLNNNDQFALLSDNFWFKVKIVKEGVENQKTPIANCSKNIEDAENLKNAHTFKRANSENVNDSLCKKQRTNNLQNNSLLHSLDISIADKLLSNLESIVAEDYGKKLSNPNEISENLNSDDDFGVLKVSVTEDSINQSIQCNHKEDENGIQNATNTVDLPEIRKHNDVSFTEANINNPTESNSNEIENSNSTAPNIQDEVLESELCFSNPNIEFEKSETAEINANVNKELDETKRNEEITEGGSKSPDHQTKIQTEEEIETECKEITASDGTSNFSDNEDHVSDNAQSRKTRRDRCWYGQLCYRKNPKHRVDFSHPGDDDYLTDPEDDRPNCPFGSDCYRVNLEHRRQFKHSGKPAAKPGGTVASTSGTSTSGASTQTSDVKKKRTHTKTNSESESGESSSESSKNTDTNILPKKKRKAAQKKSNLAESPSDDYDYQDPFIDDGSSEEFKLSDSDCEDSEFEDSQMAEEESEETRRLIKEAKKFTKRKK